MLFRNILLLTLSCLISCGKELKDSTPEPDLAAADGSPVVSIENQAMQRLYFALQSNDAGIVRSSLQEFNHLDYLFVDGQTPLIMAIENAKTEIIIQVINKTNNLNMKNSVGDSALIAAIKKNNSFVVRLLISRGADLNLNDRNKISPLEHSIYLANEEIVLLLLKNGARLDIHLPHEKSLLELAKEFQLNQVENLLPLIAKHETPSNKMLNDAIKSGNQNFLEFLLINFEAYRDLIRARNVLITAMNLENQTTRERMLRTLLSQGANPNNTEGVLPLIHATETLQKSSVEILLIYANPFLKDDEGLTALHYAVEANNYSIVEKIYRNMVAKSPNYDNSDLSQIVSSACLLRPKFRTAITMPNGYSNLTYITNLLSCY